MGNGPRPVVPASGDGASATVGDSKKEKTSEIPKPPKNNEKKLYKTAGTKISQAGTRLTELRCLETQLLGMMPEGDSQAKVENSTLPV